MNNRKTLLLNIIKEAELSKFSQELVNQTANEDPKVGQQVAEQIFDKILNELDIDSIN